MYNYELNGEVMCMDGYTEHYDTILLCHTIKYDSETFEDMCDHAISETPQFEGGFRVNIYDIRVYLINNYGFEYAKIEQLFLHE